jgi:hypothetical protein
LGTVGLLPGLWRVGSGDMDLEFFLRGDVQGIKEELVRLNIHDRWSIFTFS